MLEEVRQSLLFPVTLFRIILFVYGRIKQKNIAVGRFFSSKMVVEVSDIVR